MVASLSFTLSIGGMYGIPSSVKHLTSIASLIEWIATFNKQDSLLRVSAVDLAVGSALYAKEDILMLGSLKDRP